MNISFRYACWSLVLAAIASVTATAQTPIAHWTFDDGLNDYSVTTSVDTQGGTGADAVYADTAESLGWTAGIVGGAAILSGDNVENRTFEISEIAAMDNVFDGLTFMGWFQPAASQAGQAYKGLLMTRSVEDGVGTGKNYGIAWEAGFNIDFRTGAGGLDSPQNVLADGSWYHVAAVWDTDDFNFNANPQRTLYVNGVEVASDTDFSAFDIIDSGSWSIGRDPGEASARNFRGLVDDFAIFQGPLTAGEIMTKYTQGLAGTDAAGNSTGVVLAGDVDGGGVGMSDFTIIRNNFLTTVNGRDEGDLNGDKVVDLQDYGEWAAAAPTLAAQVSLGTVPEPSAFVLFGLAGVCGFANGSRRRNR